MGYRRKIRQGINQVLGIAGVELVKKELEFQDYIPLQKTLRDAKASGLPLGDYIDNTFNVPGATQDTIERMAGFGVFHNRIERVCEIGPGSGRYLEKVNHRCNPDYYEIYETSSDWRNWLENTYHVHAHIPNGNSLTFTPSESIDLVHTHKMLYGNSIITICQYFQEMIRVVRKGGSIVFDIMTEDCLSGDLLNRWIESGATHACSMTARNFALEFFTSRGLTFVGAFTIPLMPGVTEYFVFKK